MTSHDCAGYTFAFDLEKNFSSCSSTVGTSVALHREAAVFSTEANVTHA